LIETKENKKKTKIIHEESIDVGVIKQKAKTRVPREENQPTM